MPAYSYNSLFKMITSKLFGKILMMLAILLAWGCSGNNNSNDTAMTQQEVQQHIPAPIDNSLNSDSVVTSKQSSPTPSGIITDSYEDGLTEADALAEEDRLTGHPGHHADDYGDSDGDNEDYDEGWEDGYDL